MATPTKPGQRVMLTVCHGQPDEGPIGLQLGTVARRLNDWFNEHRWNVRLDTGQVVEVQESDLFLVGE